MNVTIDMGEDGVATVAVQGDVTVKDYRQLTETVDMVLSEEPPPTRLLVDFAGVAYIDSVGLGSLVGILSRTKRAKVEFALKNVTPSVRDSMQLTRLDQIIPME